MAIAALVTAAPASAACWSASAPVSGGDWNTPGNWVGDAVPGPTETAVFTEQGGGCGVPQDVVVSGADAEVGLIRQANTDVIVDGKKLTISGISTLGTDLLGNVHVRNGGTLAIDVGADVTVGGQIKLGNPNGGSILLDGTLRVLAGLTVTDEPAGGGALAISATGKLLYNPGNSVRSAPRSTTTAPSSSLRIRAERRNCSCTRRPR